MLQKAADPEAAEQRLRQIRENPKAEPLVRALSWEGLNRLVAVLGFSNFLFRFLMRHPEALLALEAPFDLSPPAGELRDIQRFKYRELLKVAARDLARDMPFDDLLAILTGLAEAILKDTHNRFLRDTPLCWMGLGKLGARELNFSSDVDLIFALPDGTHLPERPIREAMGWLEARTEEGFLYRVDLNLRPWGRDGPLAMPLEAMEAYYERSEEAFERMAWLRGRPVAGTLELGEELLRRLHPFVFRRFLSPEDVERLIALKGEMARHRQRPGRWNVKLGEGGIRDIEFFVQVLQILHGATHTALQTPNTLEAIAALPEAGLVEQGEAESLKASYLFLRRLEHHLQMVDELHTHDLPDSGRARVLIARSLGYVEEGGMERFEEDLAYHRAVARTFFGRILPGEALA